MNDQTDIYTRLIGRGSTRNLPYRYFKGAAGAFVGDPDANSITELSYYSNLMPKSYRDYVRGWNDATAGKDPAEGNNPYYMLGYSDMKAGRQMYPSDYADSPMQEKWGVRVGVLEDNEEIYPSIQNVWLGTLGRADEVIAVEEVTNDNYAEAEEEGEFAYKSTEIKVDFPGMDTRRGPVVYDKLFTQSVTSEEMEVKATLPTPLHSAYTEKRRALYPEVSNDIPNGSTAITWTMPSSMCTSSLNQVRLYSQKR